VVTIIDTEVCVGVPLAVTDGGVNKQAASEGSPEHVKLMVPLKPVEVAIVTDELPDEPGTETTTCDPADGTEAEKPGVMTTLCDCVVLLALKLASPP
jgi:hypothetical protein